MFDKMCPHCLSDGEFLEAGHDETGRTFKIYGCSKCRNMTRVFDTPITEREVVLVALVEEALSAMAIDSVPEREAAVEQLLMFPHMMRGD